MKRIALVEPNHSHEEVLFPLIELLRGVCEVHVIAPQSLLDVDLLHDTRHLYRAAAYIPALPQSRIGRRLGVGRRYAAIRKAVDRIGPDLVLFNSVPSRVDELCVAWFFRSHPKIRVIHNFQNCLAPLGRLLYSAFDGNLVISEQVYRYVSAHHPHFKRLGYVLPIFFGGFKAAAASRPAVRKPAGGCVKLGVFGSIEQDRRNYRGLLDALSQWRGRADGANFHVHLVGKAPAWLQAEIQRNDLQKIVTIYGRFVPFREMFDLFDDMDLVLFLIDDSVANACHYNRYKISGTSTLMKAFPKAGASSTDFALDDALKPRCYFYEGRNVQSLLEQIARGEITGETIQAKLEANASVPEYSFQRQRAMLVEMIEKAMGSS